MSASRALALFAFSAVLGGCTGWERCDPLRVEPMSIRDGTVGQRYEQKLDVPCWQVEWSLRSGSLPPGIEFGEEGVLHGTPVLAGKFAFVVSAVVDEPGEDVDGDEQLHRYHLLVNPDGSGGGGTSGEGGATGESGAGAGEAGEGGALGEGGASGGAP